MQAIYRRCCRSRASAPCMTAPQTWISHSGRTAALHTHKGHKGPHGTLGCIDAFDMTAISHMALHIAKAPPHKCLSWIPSGMSNRRSQGWHREDTAPHGTEPGRCDRRVALYRRSGSRQSCVGCSAAFPSIFRSGTRPWRSLGTGRKSLGHIARYNE